MQTGPVSFLMRTLLTKRDGAESLHYLLLSASRFLSELHSQGSLRISDSINTIIFLYFWPLKNHRVEINNHNVLRGFLSYMSVSEFVLHCNSLRITEGCRYNLYSRNVYLLSEVIIESYKQVCCTTDRSLDNHTKVCVHACLYM